MHSRNNKQEERSLKVQELSQKADYSSLLTTGTKKANPDKFKNKIVRVMNLLNVRSVGLWSIVTMFTRLVEAMTTFKRGLSCSVVDICMCIYI